MITRHHDWIYHDLLNDIMNNGIDKTNRTGTDARSVFGRMIRFDVSEFAPILTTKLIRTRSIIHELLWFIKGSTNIKYLKENGVGIWDAWADRRGELGPVYGKQWRSWDTYELEVRGEAIHKGDVYIKSPFDQLARVIQEIKENPDSRRLIVNSWNAPYVWNGDMALPPCHYCYQFMVENDTLSLMWNQRSVDTAAGLPFNILSYYLLLRMVAQITGYKPKELIGSLGDVHIYHNHFDQVREQLTRSPLGKPTILLNPDIKNIDDFRFEDFQIVNYEHHPELKLTIAV